MKKQILHFSICIIFGLSTFAINAQNDQHIDVDFIYNKWLLSTSESSDDILVYRDEGDAIFDDKPYDSDENLKFTKRNNTFYLNYLARRSVNRCGNGLQHKGKATWAKGVWNLEEEGDHIFLVLEHLNKVKGSSYKSTKIIQHQILQLDKEKMLLLN